MITTIMILEMRIKKKNNNNNHSNNSMGTIWHHFYQPSPAFVRNRNPWERPAASPGPARELGRRPLHLGCSSALWANWSQENAKTHTYKCMYAVIHVHTCIFYYQMYIQISKDTHICEYTNEFFGACSLGLYFGTAHTWLQKESWMISAPPSRKDFHQ